MKWHGAKWWKGILVFLILNLLGRADSQAQARPADASREAFLQGNVVAALDLAAGVISKASQHKDTNSWIEGLTWQGFALAAQRTDVEAEKSWSEATDLAKAAGLTATRVRLLGIRSLWIRDRDKHRAATLWNEALAATDGATPAEGLQCGRLLNLLAAAQPTDMTGSAFEAFKSADDLLEKSKAAALEQAVLKYNLGVAGFDKALMQNDTAAAEASISTAKTNIESALQVFQASGKSRIGAVGCMLQLAWLADSVDDQAGVTDWSKQYQDMVGKLTGDELLGEQMKDDHLLFIPDHETRIAHVIRSKSTAAAKENLAIGGVFQDMKSSGPILKEDHSFESSMLKEHDISPLKSFLEGWVLTEGWSGNRPSAVLNSPEGHAYEQSMSQAISENANLYKRLMLNQLPGASSIIFTPASIVGLPSVGSIEGISGMISSPPGLELDHPLPSTTAMGVLLAFSSRPSCYSAMGGIPIAGMNVISSRFMQSAIAPLLAAGEKRAAWQVFEEGRALSERRDTRFREMLSAPDKAEMQKALAEKQAESFEYYLRFLRQFTPGKYNVENSDQTLALWEKSCGYDESVKQLALEDARPLPTLLTAREAAQALPKNSIYIGFSSDTSDNCDVFLFDPQNDRDNPTITVKRISIPRFLAHQFQNKAFNPDIGAETLATMGRQLFARFFPDEIGTRIRTASRLIISPPDDNWAFPFGALVLNDSGTPKYLGLEKALSYTESIGLLKACRERAVPEGKNTRSNALVLGLSEFSLEEQKPVFERFLAESLPALRYSVEEARKVAAVYDTQAIIGKDATESYARSRIESATIIHIASHGYSRATPLTALPIAEFDDFLATMRDGTSGIWLMAQAPKSLPGFDEDGLLQAWEVRSQFKLQADLAVLSACDLGHPKAIMAYGPELPLAFLYAGARSVITAQGPAIDQSTAQLMPVLHQLIKSGMAKDEALRQALRQVQSKTEFSNPAFWAPIILIGDPDNALFNGK